MNFELIVIGTGAGGMAAVEAALEAGAKKVAVVEGWKRLGGECPNRGCVPSKALLRSAHVLELARRAEEFGLKIQNPSFDFKKVMASKQGIVDRLTKPPRLENVVKKLGVNLIRGWAKFENTNTISVSGKKYTAEKFIIATGSETFIPPIPGLKEAGFITSDEFMELKEPPKSIAIVGGGPIGIELASFLADIGSKVTIIEFMPHILPREDTEIAAVVAESFKRRGIELLTGTKVNKVGKKGKGILVMAEPADKKAGSKSRTLDFSKLMVATGKRAAVSRLGLEKIGMKLDKRGNPENNEYLQTSVKNIYVAGDVSGHMLFTHTGHYEGEVAARNAMRGNKIKIDLRVVPRGTFCRPEVGSVGMTESEARKKGIAVAVGRAPYSVLGRALMDREQEGLVKIIADKKTKEIIGGHAVGQAAAEIVHEIALAMYARVPYNLVGDMVHAYPTYAEAVGAAAFELK